MKKKTTLIISAVLVSSLIGIGFIFLLGGGTSGTVLDFTKLNNNNFSNKGKYDYMKKNTSFQPNNKKKSSPGVLRWNN